MINEPRSLFEIIEPDVMDRIAARGKEIAQGASVNSKVAAALALSSVPIALAALASDAYGQAVSSTVLTALNFALTLEYLESSFYTQAVAASTGGNAASPLIPSTYLTVFQTISGHEATHVTALQSLITTLGGTPVTSPTFSFAAGVGFTFGSSQYTTFLELAQAFEDTGVRAYKGQAANLMSNKQALTYGLAIHAVEAEHASEVRRLRGQKGWISGSNTDITFAAAVYGAGNPSSTYPSEANTTQAGVDITALATAEAANFPGITASSATSFPASEAFDEPLDMATVQSIASLFIVSA